MSIAVGVLASSRPRSLTAPAISKIALATVALMVAILIVPSFYRVMATTEDLGESTGQRAASISVARNWFVSVNRFLATGNEASFDGLLAAGFIDHHPAPGMAADAKGLLQTLDALRRYLPAIHLEVTMSNVSESVVTAAAKVMAGNYPYHGPELGNGGSDEWIFIERLRIQNNRIVERWGPKIPFTLATAQTELVVSQKPLASLARISRLYTGVGQIWNPGPAMVIVVAGEVRFLSMAGVSVTRSGEEDRGLANLIEDVVASVGDMIQAESSFTIEMSAPAELLVIDGGKYAGNNASRQFNSVSAAESSQTDIEIGKHRLGILPFSESAPGAVVKLQPLVENTPGDATMVMAMYWQTLLLPAGGFAPTINDNQVAIVTVKHGEIRVNVDGTLMETGQLMVIDAAHPVAFMLADGPAAVEMLVFTINP